MHHHMAFRSRHQNFDDGCSDLFGGATFVVEMPGRADDVDASVTSHSLFGCGVLHVGVREAFFLLLSELVR